MTGGDETLGVVEDGVDVDKGGGESEGEVATGGVVTGTVDEGGDWEGTVDDGEGTGTVDGGVVVEREGGGGLGPDAGDTGTPL